MSNQELPLSGFALLEVLAINQQYEIVSDPNLPDGDRGVSLSWDWRISEIERAEIEVFIAVSVAPTRDHPEKVNIGLVGRFLIQGDPSLALPKFVHISAPAILIPYAREMVSSLTGRGPGGPYFLPSINVVTLMEQYDYDASTGAVQIRSDPSLLQRLARIASGTAHRDDLDT